MSTNSSPWGQCKECGMALTGPTESAAGLCIPCAERATGKADMAALQVILSTRREPLDKQRTIREWLGSTKDAITALRAWLGSLQEWERHGGEYSPGDFDAAFAKFRVFHKYSGPLRAL